MIDILDINEDQYFKIKDGFADKFELISSNDFYGKKYKKNPEYFIEKLGIKKEYLSEDYFNELFK